MVRSAPRGAACGASAGGGIALWLGFRDDMAEPHSADLVARQSTRVSCMLVRNTQTSYDPRYIKHIIPGPAYRHPALIKLYALAGPEEAAAARESPALRGRIRPDPPVYLAYSQENVPLTPDADAPTGIHHPEFGVRLKQQMDRLGIECVLRCGAAGWGDPEEIEFLRRHLGAASGT